MIVYRYFTYELLKVIVAITAMLLFVFLCTESTHHVAVISSGALYFWKFIVAEISILFAIILPASTFIALLFVYNRFYADSEMTVLFAGGFGHKELVKYTLKFSAAVAALVAIFSFWVSPHVAAYQRRLIVNARGALSVKQMVANEFKQVGSAVYYAGGLSDDHKAMTDVFFSSPEKNGKISVVTASRVEQLNTTDQSQLFIHAQNGYRYDLVPGQKDVVATQYKTYGQRVAFSGDTGEDIQLVTTSQLIAGMFSNRQYAAEFQWRLAMPLAALFLSLLAIPLSHVNPRHGRFAQLLPGILIAVLYINLLYLCQDWVDKGSIPVWLGNWWVHAMLLLLVFLLMTRWAGWGVKRLLA